MPNSLDSDQARNYVEPDLGPNCLKSLSADHKSSLGNILNKDACVIQKHSTFNMCEEKKCLVTFRKCIKHTGKAAIENALNNGRSRIKIDRNSVYDCHLSPDWQQMAIKNTVSIDFLSTFIISINVFDCGLSGV